MTAGYSGTPLAKKLWLTPGMRVWFAGMPDSGLADIDPAEIGLVDVKVCAVDAIWSGLRLVIRKKLRG